MVRDSFTASTAKITAKSKIGWLRGQATGPFIAANKFGSSGVTQVFPMTP
jgi:hypothetical protein